MEVEKLAKYTIGGIFGVVVIGIIAKDGQQLGDFMKATADAFGGFAKSLSAVG
jgi:hypothetical protein